MYNWILVLHIVSIVSWFAAIFYLPRLFVYHAEHADNKEFVHVVKIMETKLYKYIGIPSFWGTIISGTLLIVNNPALLSSGGWMHAKISLVIVLSVYFFHLGRLKKKLADDSCTKSGKFFRVYNEVPTILLIAIVILVIIKPF
jgi:putative membrane protein